jgi:transposase-like protein
MECICCGPAAVTERPDRTTRGYRRFRCRDCGKQSSERSGGLFNRAQYPSDVVALVVLWRLRCHLTLRDPNEMFLERRIVLSHDAVRGWEAKLAPVLAGGLRRGRHGRHGTRSRRWHVDKTYLKVGGRWTYLYRATDRRRQPGRQPAERAPRLGGGQGLLPLGEVGHRPPDQVITDGHGSYPRAIRSTLGRRVVHRTSTYRNNRLEQDHRGVKDRTRCMRAFKSFASAEQFCRSHDELCNFLRLRTRHNQPVSTNRRRLVHLRRATTALGVLEAV